MFYLKGRYITPTINSKGQQFYLALSCDSRRINTTKGNEEWGEWFFPKEEFEHRLINDLCKKI